MTKTVYILSIGNVQFQQLTKKEMIENVWHLAIEERAIPLYKFHYRMTVERLIAGVSNAMFERFVSEVVTDSELCGVPSIEARKFAVDFIQNNDYVQMCLTATINLVLNGALSKKQQLDSFLDKLLWVHVVKACHEKLGNKMNGSVRVSTI